MLGIPVVSRENILPPFGFHRIFTLAQAAALTLAVATHFSRSNGATLSYTWPFVKYRRFSGGH